MTCIHPTVAYATETRVDNAKTVGALTVAEMRVLRATSGKTRRYRVRNRCIGEECKSTIQESTDWLKQREIVASRVATQTIAGLCVPEGPNH